MRLALDQRQLEWIELGVVLFPLFEVTSASAVARDLAGQRLHQQRMAVEAPEEGQERVTRTAYSDRAPHCHRIVVAQAAHEKHGRTRQRLAVEALQFERKQSGR